MLDEHGIEYLIVGGVAARLQGAATTTRDIDVMPEPSVDNLAKLARALSGGSTEKKEHSSTTYERHTEVEAVEFQIAEVSSYRTNCGLIDVIMELPGVGS